MDTKTEEQFFPRDSREKRGNVSREVLGERSVQKR